MKCDRRSWAGLSPNGLGRQKPNHYLDMAKVAWQNRHNLPYAWRILTRGVCDGCALGTAGLKDWTTKGPHLCTVRLNLLQINTMPPLDPRRLEDVDGLRRLNGHELRVLGRLPFPAARRKGESGFRRLTWDEALDRVAEALRRADPRRVAFYLTSRGLTNETYYAAQKAARFLGTNHIDNASRICHSPSTVALKATLGVGASTCSYADWIGADLVFLIGSNIANNQPVALKYLYYARKQGTRVVVVNPHREPGLERYWIPSITESALFGTRIADEFHQVHTGGDLAFFSGVLKHLVEVRGEDRAFVQAHTTGWEEVVRELRGQSWEDLEEQSGVARREMQDLAERYARARTAVFVWSMGVTQHSHGVRNVQAIINLALARGMVGRPYCGLMPIRGHSGVQGGAECGAVPGELPGGVPVDAPEAERFADLWGFRPPTWKGSSAVRMLEAGGLGDLDVLYAIGGNFLETLPDPDGVAAALSRVPLRVHQDITLNTSMLQDAGEEALLLPAQTRYEMPGGCTETSTERRIIFSPEVPGPRVPEARPEWWIPTEVAARAYPERRNQIAFPDAQAIRDEIARANPAYEGIRKLRSQGDTVQWGGPRLCEGAVFRTPEGKARFTPLPLPAREVPEGLFALSTRRGRQFNSMVQGRQDPLTGGHRDAVFMAEADARRLGLSEGDPVTLRSSLGIYRGVCRLSRLRPGNVQVFWPEGNVLLPSGQIDPACDVPDYNTPVEVLPGHGELPPSGPRPASSGHEDSPYAGARE